MDPIERLTSEHKRMEQLLNSLEGFIEQIDPQKVADGTRELLTFVRVLQGTAAQCHQPKEEGLLFPAMAEQGVSRSEGLIAAILREHDEERGLVAELAGLANSADLERITQVAYAISDHVRCHIYTEETVLFPLARSVLSENWMQALSTKFDAFEERRGGNQDWQLVSETTNQLIKRYGTDTSCIEPRVSWAGSED